MQKPNLAVVFGAKSQEHEVSIVTAFQAWDWINPASYNRFLIYFDRENQAYLCPGLIKKDYRQFIQKVTRSKNLVDFIPGGISFGVGLWRKKVAIDVALLLMHGGSGENGEIQGLLDFSAIPYTGSGILGSAMGMDKVVMKDIFTKMGFNVTPYVWFFDNDYEKNSPKIISLISSGLDYPLFIKPATGGSSIGISLVKDKKDLPAGIKKAKVFDHKILIEKIIPDAVDINCAVMGGYEPIASLCEQPLSDEEFLSFEEKYLKGGKTKGMAGLSRIIPAPIPEKTTKQAQEMAKVIFKELGCWGMARMDFLYQKKTGKLYPNEINTIPGSLAFYLWKASGIQPPQLVDELVKLALEKKKEAAKLKMDFRSEILDQK